MGFGLIFAAFESDLISNTEILTNMVSRVFYKSNAVGKGITVTIMHLISLSVRFFLRWEHGLSFLVFRDFSRSSDSKFYEIFKRNSPTRMREAAAATIVAILFLLGSPAVQAQSGVHAYNKTRDDAAKAAVKAWSEIDLLQVIAQEKKNIDKIQEMERQRLSSMMQVVRDNTVASCIDKGTFSNRFGFLSENSALRERLKQLGGIPTKNFKPEEWRNFLVKVTVYYRTAPLLKKRIADRAAAFAENLGVNPPPYKVGEPVIMTDDFKKTVPEKNQKFLDDYFAPYAKAVDALNAGLPSGIEVSTSNDTESLWAASKEYLEYKEALDKCETKKKDAETVLKNFKTPAKGDTKNVIQIYLEESSLYASKIKNLVDEKGDTFEVLFPKQVGLQEKVDLISEVLEAYSAGKIPETSKKPSATAQIVVSVQAFVKKVGDLNDTSKAPPITALIIQRDLAALELARVTAKIELFQKRVGYAAAAFDAKCQELGLLLEISQRESRMVQEYYGLLEGSSNYAELNLPKPGSTWLDYINYESTLETYYDTRLDKKEKEKFLPPPWRQKIGVVVDSYPSSIQMQVYQAMILQANSIVISRLDCEMAKNSIQFTKDLEKNMDSESALKAWNTLISIPLGQVADYHASGFKPEEVAQLVVEALGLGAIAWRL